VIRDDRTPRSPGMTVPTDVGPRWTRYLHRRVRLACAAPGCHWCTSNGSHPRKKRGHPNESLAESRLASNVRSGTEEPAAATTTFITMALAMPTPKLPMCLWKERLHARRAAARQRKTKSHIEWFGGFRRARRIDRAQTIRRTLPNRCRAAGKISASVPVQYESEVTRRIAAVCECNAVSRPPGIENCRRVARKADSKVLGYATEVLRRWWLVAFTALGCRAHTVVW